MSRLIDADKVQKKIESWCWKHEEYNQDDLNELCEIVRNAEEEFCEWKFGKLKNGYAFVGGCKKKIWDSLHEFKYCPYCGKEIKVVK